METQVNVAEDDLWAEKDKDSTRTYSFELSNLLPAGVSIASAVWSVSTPPGAVAAVLGASSIVAPAKLKVTVSGGDPKTWYALVCNYTASDGTIDQLVLQLFIKQDQEAGLLMGSALFPNKFAAIKAVKDDRVYGIAKGAMPGNLKVSNDYIWGKILAAESEVARTLRVELQPTQFFSLPPSQAQIDALAGKPWKLDPAYDYEPAMFIGEKWGFIVLRNKPAIAVQKISINYPMEDQSILDVPADWLRIDRKYGQINFVPSSPVVSANFATTLLGGLIGANRLPFSIHITYTAGLTDAATTYPELVDVVMKLAVLKVIEDSFPAQSGSISADGLSQSMSRDIANYHEGIELVLNGAKGGNGGLMTAIHGIRLGVM